MPNPSEIERQDDAGPPAVSGPTAEDLARDAAADLRDWERLARCSAADLDTNGWAWWRVEMADFAEAVLSAYIRRCVAAEADRDRLLKDVDALRDLVRTLKVTQKRREADRGRLRAALAEIVTLPWWRSEEAVMIAGRALRGE